MTAHSVLPKRGQAISSYKGRIDRRARNINTEVLTVAYLGFIAYGCILIITGVMRLFFEPA